MKELNTKELVSYILHILRNSELLGLSASIVMAEISEELKPDSEVVKSYGEFSKNLELRLEQSINEFKIKK